jgi:hypothetical protein
MNRRDSRHGFETRLPTRSLPATRRGFTFYVTEPLSFIHGTYSNDRTDCLMVVTVRSGSVCHERRAT